MRRGLIVFGLAVVASISSSSLYGQESASGKSAAKSTAGVKIAALIDGMEYCKGDSDVYSVHLRLRLRLTNLGSGGWPTLSA
jgi:hypothetical protein